MELTIGRDQESSRLSITIDGSRSAMYGQKGSVPKSVSRKHCTITISEGGYRVSNLNHQNITFVNETQVESRGFNPETDKIRLGSCKYELKILEILVALGVVKAPAAAPKECSIAHLEQVWNSNHDTKLQLQIKEKKTAAIRSATGLITTVSIVCACIPSMETLRIPLITISIVVGIYFAVVMYRSSSQTPIFLDKLDKQFRKDYTCPSCQKFLGYHQPYEELLKSGVCPYCKMKLTEKPINS